MRKIFSVILILLSLLFCWTGNLEAAELAKAGKMYKAIILDEANLLTPEEEQQLLQDVQPILPYGNVIFSTVRLKGRNFEKHSEDTYYKHFGNEPGVNFQIDMGNRKITLSASTDMEKIIGSERDSIVDNIYTYATKKKYYICARECFKQIDIIIKDGEIAHDMKHINNGILALILGLLVNFLIVCATARKSVPKKKIFENIFGGIAITDVVVTEGRISQRYSPRKSSGGGGGFSSGGSSGGGGGFSGGSSSHGF